MAKTAEAPAAILGIATEEQTYATRYKQGGRTVYSLALTPAQLVNMIPQPDPNLPNPGNRKIRESHARKFAEYYLANSDWVIPGIILRAPSIFSFQSHDGGDGAGWGILSYPKRSASQIQILDGQHRILGFHLAAKMIVQRLEKAKDQRAQAMRVENGDKHSPAVREAEKRIAQARALEARFNSEAVSAEIQVTDNQQQYRQMFFDIAENQLGITASVKHRFDTRKVVNRALPIVLEHPLLENRVDLENDRLSRNGTDFLTAKHVADIIRDVEVGFGGRIGTVMEQELNEREVAKRATGFLDALTEAFPQLAAMQVGQVAPDVVRTTSLLGSPGMLRALASTYHELMQVDRHGLSRDDVVQYMKDLCPHLSDKAHRNSIWYEHITTKDGQYAFIENAYSPNGRRQDIEAVSDAMVEWALLGKKGAPWVWRKPKPAPAPEKTEDEEVLEAQIEQDPELGRLLAERAEVEAQLKAESK